MRSSASSILLFYYIGNCGAFLEDCFSPDKSWSSCTQTRNISSSYQQIPEGFGFGWGSLTETQNMCRTYDHVKAISCMRRHVESSCTGVQRYVLLHAMDADGYQRAADYLCHEHNIRIFYDQLSCLKRNEQRAQKCSMEKHAGLERALLEITNAINNSSMARELNSQSKLQSFVEKVLVKHTCISQQNVLRCIEMHLIQDLNCSDNVIKLVVNYFTDLMPRGFAKWCFFSPIKDRSIYLPKLSDPDYLSNQSLEKVVLTDNKGSIAPPLSGERLDDETNSAVSKSPTVKLCVLIWIMLAISACIYIPIQYRNGI